MQRVFWVSMLALAACAQQPKDYDDPSESDDPAETEQDDQTDETQDSDDPETDSDDTDDDGSTDDTDDSATDTDEATDTEEERVDCDEAFTTEVADGSDCLVGSVDTSFDCAEGESWLYVGTNEGGSTHYNAELYDSNYCFVTDHDYEGEEFVVEFNIPADAYADIALYSPCADLSLITLRTNDECPSNAAILNECDGDDDGTDMLIDKLWGYNNGYRYEVVVDADEGVVGNFELSITCY